MSKIIIIGGGPAGVSAALYVVRAGLEAVIIENGPGGLAKAHKIENYYGAVANGVDLYNAGLEQAKALGVTVLHDEVIGVEYMSNFVVTGKELGAMECDVLLLATGTKNITLRVPGLQALEGRGVSYCAVCDGFFFRGKRVGVVGSGAYALHEAEYLKQLAEVTVFTNGEDTTAAQAAGFAVEGRKLTAIEGEQRLTAVVVEDGTRIELDGLFMALGTAGSSDIARKLGAETDGRFIKTNEDGATLVPGLYAAGDCTGGLLQVSKAVCDGAKAGTAIVRYMKNR